MQKVSTESALSPLIWVLGLLVGAATVVAFSSSDLLKYILSGMAVVDLCAILSAYFILLLRKPDMLQSEGYQISVQKLSLLKDERFKGQEQLIERMTTNGRLSQIGSDHEH